MTDLDAVLTANRTFYQAFALRDPDAMDRLWAREAAVSCIHPGWPPLLDRAVIMGSWRNILHAPSALAMHCGGSQGRVYGTTALVLCEEIMEETVFAATNLFVLEQGQWRMVHHQATPIAVPTARPASPPRPQHLH
jgi:hypothetical protein